MIIGFPCKPVNKGGPGNFQRRFEERLKQRGYIIVYPDNRITPDIIIVLGNTKHLWWLIKSKIRGSRIIYRLGGINWLYKHKPQTTHLVRIKIAVKKFLMRFSQRVLGNSLIFQSEFAKKWLIKLGQSIKNKDNAIIYNGVNTDIFRPYRSESGDVERTSILCVEGNLDYTPYAMALLNFLHEKLIITNSLKEIKLYGDFENESNKEKLNPGIKYYGLVSPSDMPEVYRKSIYLSLDINAACPNAVLEAMASGIPVVGFDTGALGELVKDNAGILVPYGGNPWNLDKPDFDGIAKAILLILDNYEFYSKNARSVALEKFSIDLMTHNYLAKIVEVRT